MDFNPLPPNIHSSFERHSSMKPLPGHLSLCGKLKSMNIHSNLPHSGPPNAVWHQKKRAALEFWSRSAHVQLNISRPWTHTNGQVFAPSELLVKEKKKRSQLSCFLSFQPSFFISSQSVWEKFNQNKGRKNKQRQLFFFTWRFSEPCIVARVHPYWWWINGKVLLNNGFSHLCSLVTKPPLSPPSSLHFGSVMTRALEHRDAFLTPLRPYSASIWLRVLQRITDV